MTVLLAAVLKLAGAVFLFAAALGVIRFSDPLQRMHAATKAGTVGAGFVILGAMIEMGGWDVVIIGTAALAFLLVTIPIAGHLLGRAAYVCGSELTGLKGEDALDGILPRSEETLDERLKAEEKEG